MNLTEIAVLLDPRIDAELVKSCKEHLDRFGLHCETKSFSAMTDPDALGEYVGKATERGIKVFIIAQGPGSKLSSFVAARTMRPVIAIPFGSSSTTVSETLLDAARTAEGVPVAVMTAGDDGGGKNAAILAAQILALSDNHLNDRLRFFKQNGCRFS